MGLKKIQMITIEVSNNDGLKALEALEQKKQIRIIEKVTFDSPTLPDSSLSLKEFKDWIADRENSPTISLQEFKRTWAAKRKQLQKLAERDSRKKRGKT